MALDCNVDALIMASKCFLTPPISESEREAIEIFIRMENLKASGGPEFASLDELLTAAKEWQPLVPAQLQAFEVAIAKENAIANGATSLSTMSIEELKEAARCIECVPRQHRCQLLKFLRCAISATGNPD
jgi:hypothetical protein